MVTEIYSSVTTSISELKKNPIKAASHDVVCVLNRCKPAFYTVTPERMAELLDAHEALRRVTRSIHSMHEGGQINWAVMDTLQSSIDGNINEMPF